MDFNLSKECVGKALLIQSPPGIPWEGSQAAGCLIRVWMRLCCRKATEKTIASPWFIDFCCDGNSSHRPSLHQSPLPPASGYPLHTCAITPRLAGCTSIPADSQWFACLQVAGSVSRWSFRQRWHGQHLAGSSQGDWCTPTAQQLISSKQLHLEISVPDKLPPLEHTQLSPAFPEYRFFPISVLEPLQDKLLQHSKVGCEPTAFIWLIPHCLFKGVQTWIPPTILK